MRKTTWPGPAVCHTRHIYPGQRRRIIMNTRTIAIAALVIAVILLLVVLL